MPKDKEGKDTVYAVAQAIVADQEDSKKLRSTSCQSFRASLCSNSPNAAKAAGDTSTNVLAAAGELSKQAELHRSEVSKFLGTVRAA